MYVCICKAVSDGEIKSAVAEGVTDLESLSEKLGVGTGCGTCREFTHEIIQQELSRNSLPAADLSYAV